MVSDDDAIKIMEDLLKDRMINGYEYDQASKLITISLPSNSFIFSLLDD